MSTTIKRVALVAVAALGLGVLAVAPSQATINADSLTLSSATASQTTAETSTATSAVATISYLSGGTGTADSMTVSAALVSGPATSTALPYLTLVETSSAVVDSISAVPAVAIAPNTTSVIKPLVSGTQVVTAKYRVWVGTGTTAAPTVAGTYVVKITPALGTGASGAGNATAQTLTITVTTAASLDTVATSATVYLNKGETNSATSDDTVTGSKTASTTDAAATIVTTLKNAAGVTTTGESYTATVSGPGTLGSAAFVADGNNGASALGRALTVKAGDIVALFPDGSSGVSTVTISSKAGVVLATKTVTFYGDATAATSSVVKTIISATSGQNAILVNLKDAAGTTISNATTFYVTSSDVTKIAGSYTSTGSISYSSTNGTLGAGYLIPLTGVAAGTANITVGTKSSATATTGVVADAVSVRVGSATPASVSVTTDKSTYAPGEKATITVVVKDSTGLALADGTYTNIFATGGIVADYSLGSGSDTTTATSVDGFAKGVKTFSVFMPLSSSAVKFSWTTGTNLATANQAVAGSVTVNVVNTIADAATDAANEATDAANAATDAALAAADAADAATAAAQDASDAVAALSAQVAKLVSDLKAQIKSLTNLVIKIQKKVKA